MTEPTDTTNGVEDFTLPREPHRFKIDDDVFAAPAIISPIALQRVATMHASLGGVDKASADGIERMLKAIAEVFKIFLPGASGRRFAERLLSTGEPDLTLMASQRASAPGLIERMIEAGEIPETEIIYLQPIDLTRQALPALYWLMERYGLRPTQQSSPLPSGLGTGDLTAGAPETVSTGGPSLGPTNS